MSWNYTVHQINRSFEQIGLWYQDFLRRSENAFRALHERVSYLETQQVAAQRPTDEQVERALRKILAECFAPDGGPPVREVEMNQDPEFFVRPKDRSCIPKPPIISPAKLAVDPEAVPSRSYGETLRMLQEGLTQYPQADVASSSANVPSSSANVASSSQQGPTSTGEPGTSSTDFAKTHGRPW